MAEKPAHPESDDESNPFDIDDDWAADVQGDGDEGGAEEDLGDWDAIVGDSTTANSPQKVQSVATSSLGTSDSPPPQHPAPVPESPPSPAHPPAPSQPAEPEEKAEAAVVEQPAAPVAAPVEASSPVDSNKGSEQVPQQAAPAPTAPAPAPLQEEAEKEEERAPEPEVNSEEIEPAAGQPEVAPPVRQQTQPQQQRGGGWGGWGSGWGISSLGVVASAVKGAVRDVKELGSSLQQALAQVESDDDDGGQTEEAGGQEGKEEQAAGKAAGKQQPQPQSAEGSPASDAAASSSKAKAAAAEPDPSAPPAPPQEFDRSAEKEVEDPELEAGLKVIDEQVEQLATGAAKALTSLWGGLSGVAKNTVTLVSKVEAATKELAKDLVSSSGVSEDVAQLQASVRGVATNVTRIGTRLEKGLETVGRTALGLFEGVTAQYARGSGGGDEGREGGQVPAGAAAGEPKVFEDFFYLYGGQQLCEELEALANECARTCNKSRTRLEASQQEELDATLGALGPLFSMQLGGPNANAGVALEAASQGAAEQLDQRYTPVSYLCQDSQVRAEAFQQALLAAAEQQLQQQQQGKEDGAASGAQEAGKKKSKAGKQKAGAEQDKEGDAEDEEEEEEEDAPAEEEEEEEGGSSAGPKQPPVQAALAGLQAHAAKRMAELATAQVQLLVDHGSSISAPARSAKEMEGTVSWPPAPTQQAVLLRQQCARMIADLRAVGQGYKAAVIALQGALPQPEAAPAAPAPPPTPAPAEAEKEEGAAGQADAGAEAAPAPAAPAPSPLEAAHAAATSLERELGNAVGCAVSRVEEGFRGLLYSVLLRELVTHIATDAEPA